jgi:hypothetical protein
LSDLGDLGCWENHLPVNSSALPQRLLGKNAQLTRSALVNAHRAVNLRANHLDLGSGRDADLNDL